MVPKNNCQVKLSVRDVCARRRCFVMLDISRYWVVLGVFIPRGSGGEVLNVLALNEGGLGRGTQL